VCARAVPQDDLVAALPLVSRDKTGARGKLEDFLKVPAQQH